MDKLEKLGIILGSILVVILLAAGFFRVTFVDFVDNYEFGYKFNSMTGEITVLEQSGYFVTMPFVTKIHTIDTRPFQVNISANSRVLNAKLIQFDRSGYKLFIAWHGRGDYDKMALEPILTSYAFDPSKQDYPFLKVLKELKNDNSSYSQKPTKADSTVVIH